MTNLTQFTIRANPQELLVRTGCCGAMRVRSKAHLYQLVTDVNFRDILLKVVNATATNTEISYLSKFIKVI